MPPVVRHFPFRFSCAQFCGRGLSACLLFWFAGVIVWFNFSSNTIDHSATSAVALSPKLLTHHIRSPVIAAHLLKVPWLWCGGFGVNELHLEQFFSRWISSLENLR